MHYNDFVTQSFANPEYVLQKQDVSTLKQSKGGQRDTGVEYTLFFDKAENKIFYKCYGSPYAIAAAEGVSKRFANGELNLGDKFDLEALKDKLEMPYNYFFILIALEDAWLGLNN